ncbi:DUF6146 family protein [Mesoflavibacter profundi]|uniref:DUF6146 family protein n=1 Tax=Mesoflavibacter profundi TaxID=2708110 RepID=UPI00351790EB
MKYLSLTFLLVILFYSCGPKKQITTSDDQVNIQKGDTIKISNVESDYEIIIIEPGFNNYLNSIARPEGFYSQTFLENKNIFYVQAWNNRVLQPQIFSPNLYEMQINYQQNIDYGYEVNYKLYNYFIYFQNKYKQNLLGGRVPVN